MSTISGLSEICSSELQHTHRQDNLDNLPAACSSELQHTHRQDILPAACGSELQHTHRQYILLAAFNWWVPKSTNVHKDLKHLDFLSIKCDGNRFIHAAAQSLNCYFFQFTARTLLELPSPLEVLTIQQAGRHQRQHPRLCRVHDHDHSCVAHAELTQAVLDIAYFNTSKAEIIGYCVRVLKILLYNSECLVINKTDGYRTDDQWRLRQLIDIKWY